MISVVTWYFTLDSSVDQFVTQHVYGPFQVINDFKCEGGVCERAVLVEMGVPHKVMLFPNGTATYNSKFINMPKTVDKTIILEKLGVHTVVRLLSGE